MDQMDDVIVIKVTQGVYVKSTCPVLQTARVKRLDDARLMENVCATMDSEELHAKMVSDKGCRF